MINEITCNSNNAIEMSRGELLQWVNTVLKANYIKIEQMGTGVAFCQLLDILYPGKVPLSKVNTKAKFDYQYINNFKVLQQSFTKLNIIRHIEIEKLVKCKYQDNFEFLQWFKKIFDTANPYHIQKQVNKQQDKENTQSEENKQKISSESRISCSDTNEIKKYIPSSAQKTDQKMMLELYSSSQQKQYFLNKIIEIDQLMDSWRGDNTEELRNQIKNIIPTDYSQITYDFK